MTDSTDSHPNRHRLGKIDLSTGKISMVEIDMAFRNRFLGGRGLNMRYLFEILKNYPSERVDAFDGRNPLIIGAGLLTGTGAPSSSRLNVTTVSPESKVFCDANMGGFFGSQMRLAGFDMLIITGKAPVLSYLHLENGQMEIRRADFLKELTTSKTQEVLRERLGARIEVLCIGPAGENLVRYACIINGLKNAAGRGGAGAVMGSKNLKAIVAGTGAGIPLKDPEKFLLMVTEINQYLANSRIIKTLGEYGTPLLYEVSNLLGAIRTKNSQLNTFSESLNASEVHHYVEKMVSCSSCVVHCRHRNTVPHGHLKGGEGPEYSTLGLLGANLGISNVQDVIALNNLVNDLGLDSSSTGSVLSWIIETYERGEITGKTLQTHLEYGNYELIEELIRKTSFREGFGRILAEGRHAAKILGISEDLLIAVKGLPQSDPHDVRFIKSFALGIATATRGADHLRSRPTLDILTSIPDEIINKLYKAKIDRDPTSYSSKEHLVYFSENLFAVE
ncbi:MAG TPA: aldehyde ferredoxin oxidoreductase N-terminal domain-containing protein, partial [Candidatus Hodarchaeales archaeon]|nr:aldehyde ferredoxin oxidoreductase N-terminal domain-containing protein [Candidatus Hodarchaeales archaeon]